MNWINSLTLTCGYKMFSITWECSTEYFGIICHYRLSTIGQIIITDFTSFWLHKWSLLVANSVLIYNNNKCLAIKPRIKLNCVDVICVNISPVYFEASWPLTILLSGLNRLFRIRIHIWCSGKCSFSKKKLEKYINFKKCHVSADKNETHFQCF